jgi:hypothetical protein
MTVLGYTWCHSPEDHNKCNLVLMHYFNGSCTEPNLTLLIYIINVFITARFLANLGLSEHNSSVVFYFQAARRENMTFYNLTNMTEEELKGYVNDNPDLFFYQLVYGLTFCVMMFIGLMKGIGIARQLLLGMYMLHCFESFGDGHINLCD